MSNSAENSPRPMPEVTEVKQFEDGEREWIEEEKMKKMLSLKEVRAVPVIESGEKLVSLKQANIYTYMFRNEQESGASNDTFLRQSIVRDLQDINSELEALGLELMVSQGWRHPDVQQRQYNEAIEKVKQEHPDWDDEAIAEEAAIFSFPPDVAPHITGAAVDVTLAERNSHTPVDMGSAVNRDGVKMWRDNPFVSEEGKKNRAIINEVFKKRGFFLYPGEYWHFSKGDKEATAYLKNLDHAIYGPIYPDLSE